MAKSEFYGAYAGQPHTFACAICRKSPRFFNNRSTVGRNFEPTGKTRRQRSRGSNHHGWPGTAYEYKCLDCGHVGWSRHPDVMRKFKWDARQKAFQEKAQSDWDRVGLTPEKVKEMKEKS